MTEADFVGALEEILEVDSGRLKPGTSLADLSEWDSVAVVSFIAVVDERVGVTLNAKSIQGCTTVRDLMGLLGEAIKPA